MVEPSSFEMAICERCFVTLVADGHAGFETLNLGQGGRRAARSSFESWRGLEAAVARVVESVLAKARVLQSLGTLRSLHARDNVTIIGSEVRVRVSAATRRTTATLDGPTSIRRISIRIISRLAVPVCIVRRWVESSVRRIMTEQACALPAS